jgi:FlaG/FlaF family flagellin (archaellin)
MRKWGECKEAVSPVIGVTLMVGLTVIMSSAVAVSVFTFTIPESAPHAKIVVVEANGDMGTLYKNTIFLKHKGGDALHENDTKIIITGKGCAYIGTMGSSCILGDMRATYENLNGDNYFESYDELIEGTSWDAGETITLYGSDGRDLDFLGDRHNTVDSKWKLKAGSTVSITIIDTTTNEVIAVSQATVKDA